MLLDNIGYENIFTQIIERFTSQKGGKGLSTNIGVSRRISLFHKNLKNLVGVKLEIIKVKIYFLIL